MKAAGIGVKGHWPRIAEIAVVGPGKGRIGFSPGAALGAQFVVMCCRAMGLLYTGGQKCLN